MMMPTPTQRITLKKWKSEHPTTNPFANCLNVSSYGGADLLYSEFTYRYGNREIFDEDEFINAVERVFVYNQYKYERLLATTTQVYDMFTNYKINKVGSEQTSYALTNADSGTDTFKKGSTSTTTDTTRIETTKTPRVETTTQETPAAKIKETVTPQTEEVTEFEKGITMAEESEKGITTTTTRTPESYTDTVSRTTYDDTVNFNNVQQTSHIGSAGGTETVTPSSGKDIVTTKPVGNGKDTTTKSYAQGSKVETVVELLDNTHNTTVVSKTGVDTDVEAHSGTKSTAGSGQDETIYGKSTSKSGTETLLFNNRTDSGYMYREPQNAIKDERSIAYFAILNDILSDVERATLLSIY